MTLAAHCGRQWRNRAALTERHCQREDDPVAKSDRCPSPMIAATLGWRPGRPPMGTATRASSALANGSPA